MTPPTKLVFTLVHGTFASGAGWVTCKDSKFRTRLQDSLSEYDVEFDDNFSWGQVKWRRFLDNSESARERGIKGLQGHLQDKPRELGTKRFIVAHSHAGNIALHALTKDHLRESVDGVACLATPFLFPLQRRIPTGLLVISALALVTLASTLFQEPELLSPGCARCCSS